MNTSSGDYSFYQLALVSGLQKDYTGKITLLNRLVGKYPASPYAVNAIYEKGRSYVLMDNNNQAITSFKELLTKYPRKSGQPESCRRNRIIILPKRRLQPSNRSLQTGY